MKKYFCDVVIVGAGIAGLSAALAFDENAHIGLIAEDTPSGSTPYAQGGIAFAEEEEATIDSHIRDTIVAGAGLCDESVVKTFIKDSRKTVAWLQNNGVFFAVNRHGNIDKQREAAHSVSRIAHAKGDSTGIVISQSLYERVQQKNNITCFFSVLHTLIVDTNGRACGIETGKHCIIAKSVIFATGGTSSIFGARTAPSQPNTAAFQLALRAGALACDMEFFQHHPTALDVLASHTNGQQHLPLISESVRGHGAKLMTSKDRPLAIDHPSGSLAPRDVVGRAVFKARQQGLTVYLDTRDIADFEKKFPTVTRYCKAHSIDRTHIPVRTAVHYQIGGIKSNIDGVTAVEGLYVIGEAAATGLHGANRLASNALLEAAVMGRRAAKSIERGPWRAVGRKKSSFTVMPTAMRADVHAVNDSALGIVRCASSLLEALFKFSKMPQCPNIVTSEIAMLFALFRKESIGCHYRSDYPQKKAYGRRSMNLQRFEQEIKQIR